MIVGNTLLLFLASYSVWLFTLGRYVTCEQKDISNLTSDLILGLMQVLSGSSEPKLFLFSGVTRIKKKQLCSSSSSFHTAKWYCSCIFKCGFLTVKLVSSSNQRASFHTKLSCMYGCATSCIIMQICLHILVLMVPSSYGSHPGS